VRLCSVTAIRDVDIMAGTAVLKIALGWPSPAATRSTSTLEAFIHSPTVAELQ